ncbi:PKD domain-containing protein [Candidatus Bipolaricaulota bacterium]|nr:PKD domain-containing protein [Candidatus Bipolaricaulota bacterium]
MKRILFLLLIVVIGLVSTSCFGPAVRPTVDFTWCPDGSSGLLSYHFFSHSTTVPGHYITTFNWQFDDGSSIDDYYRDVIHRFPEEGTYFVTLVATDDRGVSGTASKEVHVQPAAFIRTWKLALGFPVQVYGEVENRCGDTLPTVTLKAKFYDADGLRLTDGTVVINDLEPGERAAFTVKAQEYSSRIFYATVAVESFTVDCPEIFHPVPMRTNAPDR